MSTKEQRRAKRKKSRRTSRRRSAADRARAHRAEFIAQRSSSRPRNEVEDPTVATREMEGMHTGPTIELRPITLQDIVDWAALQRDRIGEPHKMTAAVHPRNYNKALETLSASDLEPLPE